MAAIGDARAITPLLNLLQSNHKQFYQVLIEALGTLKVWSARLHIEPFLKHPSKRVQCAAARYLYLLTQKSQYIERIVKNLSHDNMDLRWAAIFDLGAISHCQAVQAIIAAKVLNSLKLLNLKRILEAVLDSDRSDDATLESQVLLSAIDNLLIQL